eukprot:3941920-Rhodomonas_salina.6
MRCVRALRSTDAARHCGNRRSRTSRTGSRRTRPSRTASRRASTRTRRSRASRRIRLTAGVRPRPCGWRRGGSRAIR